MTPRLTKSPTSAALLPDSFSPSSQLVVSTRRDVNSVKVRGTTICSPTTADNELGGLAWDWGGVGGAGGLQNCH